MAKRVLYIEDDKIDQMAFKRWAEGQAPQYAYTIAESVEEAKQNLSLAKFDLIICDFMLGDGTGFDVFNSIIDTPFVVVTGGGSEEVAVEAIKAGASDYLVKDSDQSYLTVLPMVIDMTIQNHTNEQKLRMLSKAMMSIRDSVYITDQERHMTYVNEAFLTTYGYEEKEILGQSSDVLLGTKTSPDDTGESEIFHRRKNGSEFLVSFSTSVMKDKQGQNQYWITVVHDLTERKKLENALLDAIEKYSTLLDMVESRNLELEKKAHSVPG